jgi:holin-like protein
MDRGTNSSASANRTPGDKTLLAGATGDTAAPISASLQKPAPKAGAAVSGLIGLGILLALSLAGGDARKMLHLSLPGPVIGLALLAVVFLVVERFHAWSHRHLTLHLVPVSRALVSHMGLLFVPAGVGIITEGDALRRDWLPIVAALVGSTLIGLIATGWLMHRFAPKSPGIKP